MIGRTLSHYKVLQKLGSGGMGDVYLARDTELDREVALKVLPPDLAASEERRARFKREAKAVAALNHPHIVTVHSVEEADGVHFITMELVRGKTLSEVIPKKGLPLANFLEIAIPLADAVSAAHENGVLHRDLKPDNLMLGDDGRLKVLDFGLAKLKPEGVIGGVTDLPTKSRTEEGRIVGTVSYMSPEQAEGKTLDARSDIFSLGIVLYEMATGERPFRGETTASVFSSILKDTPRSVTEINPALPSILGRIIRRCLVKDPEHRYQTVKDLRNELQELKREADSGELPEGVAHRKPAPPRWVYFVAASLLTVGLSLYLLLRSPEKMPSPTPTFTQLTNLGGVESFPSLSLDGNSIAYVKGGDIYLQRVGGQNAINLTEDSTAVDTQPAFSPGSARIAFRSERDGGGIFVMGATGESVKRVSDAGFNPAWSPDGELLVFSTEEVASSDRGNTGALRVVRIDTGEVRAIETNGDAVQPQWSPHGNRIAFWSNQLTEGSYRDIWTVSFEGFDLKAVTRDEHVDWNPVWSPDGKYLYFCSNRGGAMSLWRVAIEEAAGEVLSEPELVTASPAVRVGQIALAPDGRRIAYQADVSTENLYRIAFDPVSETVFGQPTALTSGSRWANDPDLSPDDQWVAFTFFSGGGQSDIAVIRSDGTGLRQLTDEPHLGNFAPRWSPDGGDLLFHSARGGQVNLWSIHPDGSRLRQLTETPSWTMCPVWSPDGKRIAYCTFEDTYIFHPSVPWKAQSPEKLPRPRQGTFWVNSWSPDGERLAGAIESELGASHIATFSLIDQEYEVFPVAGAGPLWLSDGRRLLFWEKGKVFLLDGETGGSREVLSLEPDAIDYFGLSSDDRTIYFSWRHSEADIWMVTLDETP
jgi:serine/threonine protein kinase/dipeptidyl aminopeptidase/acylaminoacyl peptidase